MELIAKASQDMHVSLKIFLFETATADFESWSKDYEKSEILFHKNWDIFSWKRKKDFMRGRYAAWRVLEQLGCVESEKPLLDAMPSGAPCWPHQVHGSISHCDSACCAAAAIGQFLIGIDVEDLSHGRSARESRNEFVFPKDVTLTSMSPEVSDTLLFSAKESVYKAVSATLETESKWIQFDNINILAWCEELQSFDFSVVTLNDKSESGTRVLFQSCGFYSLTPTFVFTFVCVPEKPNFSNKKPR